MSKGYTALMHYGPAEGPDNRPIKSLVMGKASQLLLHRTGVTNGHYARADFVNLIEQADLDLVLNGIILRNMQELITLLKKHIPRWVEEGDTVIIEDLNPDESSLVTKLNSL